ncbi:hypothetical protein [Streptomyces sp. PA5.6]|uniref:hypothetical protein n=1 Tax=Streptomyces sp. PA5.6 TaxID=3035651 RepID=UPI003904D890
MLTVYSALSVGLWMLALSLSIMTAGAGGRDTFTLSERVALPAARRLAKRRGEAFAEQVESLDASLQLSPAARRYLQREDLLAMVEMWGMGVRWVPTACLGLVTGGLLALRVSRSELGVWTDSLAQFVLVAVVLLTMLALFWTSTPQKSRWTTWPMSGNARRAFRTLLTEIQEGADVGQSGFRQPQAPAVRDLEHLAYSMEHYALKRALPNTRTPMVGVVRIFGAAAQDVRSLRDAVEIDREGGRDRAAREVRRMIEVLASDSVRDLARPMEDPSTLLQQTSQRSHRLRRGAFVALFTVLACLLAFVLIRAELPEPAAVVIAAILGLWVQQMRLSGDAN